MVRVYFDILEWDFLLEEHEERVLDDGAELDCLVTYLDNPERMRYTPARIKLEGSSFWCAFTIAHVDLILQNKSR